jgi:hypothetical protein
MEIPMTTTDVSNSLMPRIPPQGVSAPDGGTLGNKGMSDAETMMAYQQSLIIKADQQSIDKALADIENMKAALNAICQELSSLRDGGANVSLKRINTLDLKARTLEAAIQDRQSAVGEAQNQLKA